MRKSALCGPCAVRLAGDRVQNYVPAPQHILSLLPAALERESQRKLREKLLTVSAISAAIPALYSARQVLICPPAGSVLYPTGVAVRNVSPGQRRIALLEQSLEIAPGGEKSGSL